MFVCGMINCAPLPKELQPIDVRHLYERKPQNMAKTACDTGGYFHCRPVRSALVSNQACADLDTFHSVGLHV